MGLKEHPETMDEVSVRESCRAVSQEVDDYLNRELYLTEMEDEDNISDGYIDYRCLEILCEELEKLGIFLTVPRDEMILDGYRPEILLHLRTLVDGIHFGERYGLLSDDHRSRIRDSVTMTEMSDVEDMLRAWVDTLSIVYPHDPAVSLVQEQMNLFQSDESFVSHVIATMDAIDAMGPKSVVTETNVEEVAGYLQDRSQHKYNVTSCATQLMSKFQEGIDRSKVMGILKNYDNDLIDSDKLPVISLIHSAMEAEGDVDYSGNDHPMLVNHRKSHPHHPEYYDTQGLEPDGTARLLLVSEHYDPDKGRETFMGRIRRMISKFPVITHFAGKEMMKMAESVDFHPV